jgi:hypothetical protein
VKIHSPPEAESIYRRVLPENSQGGIPTLEERLERIKVRESQGLISQEDYEKMKQKILSDATF